MPDERKKLLLIEDDPEDALVIRRALAEAGGAAFALERRDSLGAGAARLAEGGIDLVLLDLSLPDSRGLDTVIGVREQAPDVPIVVLTGADDEALATRAIQEGAQDYLVKGRFGADALGRAIRYAIERQRLLSALRQRTRELRTSRAHFHNVVAKNADAS